MASKIKADQFETLDGNGNITLNNSVTMASTKTLPAASLTGTVPTASLGSGTASSSVFLRGDGSWQTAGSTSASDLTSGTLPMARLSGTLPALNASALTAIPAANITGTLPAISGANLTGLTSGAKPNLIRNGDMQIAQRSETNTVAQANNSNEGFATVDGWSLQFGTNAGGTITTSRATEAPAGFGTSYKLDVTTADTSISGNELVYFTQVIEAQHMRNSGWEYTSASSDITLSFWVKNSKTGIYCIALISNDSGRMYTAEYTVSSANTWEKKTITISGNANLVFNNDADYGLTVYFMLANASGRSGTAGSWQSGNLYGTSNQVNFLDSTSNIMYLTGIKLEVGDTATDFVHRSYGEELRLCQRYYQRYGYPKTFVTSASANHIDCTQFGWCIPLDADDVGTHHVLPVEMRATPTCSITESHIELSSASQNHTSGITLQVQSSSSTHMTMHFDTGEGLTTTTMFVFSFQNAAGYYDLSAELS